MAETDNNGYSGSRRVNMKILADIHVYMHVYVYVLEPSELQITIHSI